MGSVVMEPEDIAIFADHFYGDENITTICSNVAKVSSRGIFRRSDPLSCWVPLLLMQMTLACGAVLLVSQILRPLSLPIVVRQLLAGILLGPSFLCRNRELAAAFFPVAGFIMLDIVASFGFILYFFIIGVQMDPWILKHLDRKAFGIGTSGVLVPMVLSTASSFLLMNHFKIDENISRSLPSVAQAESVFTFPVIAHFLAELKIINSEFGRLALSSSFIAGFCSVSIVTANILMQQSPGDNYRALQTLTNGVVLVVIIVFIIRPIIMQMIKNNPAGEPLKQHYVIWILLSVLVTGFLGHVLGLHLYFGPLVLGITIPSGPPIGSTLVEKLDLLANWIFMPLYMVKNGLIINIFSIKFKNYLIVQFIALVSSLGKFLGTFIISHLCNIPTRDAVSLGLVMNAQGVLEIGLFKLLKRNKAINSEAFVIMSISMILVNGSIVPLIKHLYDPSRRYAVYRKRTVMNLKSNLELRVLVCIHENEEVPAAINIIKALNPTKKSPLYVYVLHLVELVGRANPLLIPHKLSKSSKVSAHVVNAFRSFEQSNRGVATVFPFTAICPTITMHDDVCTMALDRRTSLVIVPFHKRFHANGMMNSIRKNIKVTNMNVLEKAPCSVAILVDRGFLNSTKPIYDSHSYRVAVLFLGGLDDREALAIGGRMAGNQNIHLTMIRLLENGSISSDDVSERKIDNEVVSNFRTATAGNHRVMYIEEVVMDGSGTISVIRSMEDHYELVIVGRYHEKRSQLLSGLTDWNDNKELGTVGDVFVSAQFMVNTTILVVKQHADAEKEGGQNARRNIGGSGRLVKDGEKDHLPISN